ncbi:MAG: alpha/beta hydrolase family esterase [Polyangiaceae bacterium]
MIWRPGILAAIILVGGCSSSAMNSANDDSDAGAIDAGSGSFSDAGAHSDSGVASSGDSGTNATCGLRGGTRGLSSRSISVNGTTRTYLAYLPASVDASKPVPFVFVFHGYLMSGQQMHDITGYSKIADTDGVAVVFPDGESGPDSILPPWNVESSGETVCGAGQIENASGDDFAFMDAMKGDVLQDQCIDDAHVFATGFSMGGYLSHHIACHRSDVRAVAPHSSGTVASLTACTTGHTPMIIFHGLSDPTIAPGCDDPSSAAQAGYPASAALWAAKNGCKSTSTAVSTNGSGGGDGTCFLYDGCPADGQVELCTFSAMTHCWAGGDSSGEGSGSACPTYASATELEWSFFKTYAW